MLHSRIPGITNERLAELIREAETGYNLEDLTTEPNPHAAQLRPISAKEFDKLFDTRRNTSTTVDCSQSSLHTPAAS